MSRVLVLPGNKWQVPLVKKVLSMSNEVFVVSPESDAPCKVLSTEFLQSDIFDVETIEKYAKEKRIEAILSDECDIVMPIIAEIGRRLKLSTLSVEDAALYTDKSQMREFCSRIGVKTPEYKLCRKMEDAVSFLEQLGKPIIIKPIDSNASHGVFIIENEKQIREHFEEALSFSRVKKEVIAERFIEGTEFTVDGIKTLNEHYTLAISEKKHYKHNPSIANELFFTHKNIDFDYEVLKHVNDTFVKASGLRFGFTHAEYKYENGYYYLIEIAARGGGNMISGCITQFMSGHDTYAYLIKSSIDKPYISDFSISKDYMERACVLKFFETPCNGGFVKEIYGIDYFNEETRIKDWGLNFKVSDRIGPTINDSTRIGYYIACCEDEKSLRNVMKTVEEKFKIVTTPVLT